MNQEIATRTFVFFNFVVLDLCLEDGDNNVNFEKGFKINSDY